MPKMWALEDKTEHGSTSEKSLQSTFLAFRVEVEKVLLNLWRVHCLLEKIQFLGQQLKDTANVGKEYSREFEEKQGFLLSGLKHRMALKMHEAEKQKRWSRKEDAEGYGTMKWVKNKMSLMK